MKTQIFAVLFFAISLHSTASNLTSGATVEKISFPSITIMAAEPAFAKAMASKGGDPTDLKVVFSQKRIWLLADEMPMKCLKTVVKNSAGKVVLEKCFTSKCTEWFLNIEALPKGDYTFYLGADRVEKFKK